MQTIIFTDRTPNPYLTNAGIQGENGVTNIVFQVPTNTTDNVHLPDFTPSLKCEYPDETFDSIILSAVSPTELDATQSTTTWTVIGRATHVAGNVNCTLEFYDTTDNRVWHTDEFALQINPAVMADVALADTTPTAIQQMQNDIAAIGFAGETSATAIVAIVNKEVTVTVTDSPTVGGHLPSYFASQTDLASVESSISLIPSHATTETDVTVIAGQCLYVKNNGHLALARANQLSTSNLVGLAITGGASSTAIPYTDSGTLVLDDWTPVVGQSTLVSGSVYYLDPDNVGGMTTVAPTVSGSCVVQIGEAISADSLMMNIQLSILL